MVKSVVIYLWVILVFFSQPALAAGAKDIWADAPYESTDVDMKLIKVSAHSYYVQGPPGTPTDNNGFMSNAGVVITNEGVVVIDALGTPSLAYLLLARIREISDQPIVKVVTTHYHADHIYGLQVFKAEGAEIIAPLGAKDYLASDAAEGRLKERRESLFPWVDEKTHLVKPDVYVSQQTQFQLGGLDFVIMPLGSTHSNGDQMLLVEQDKALYSGDLIFEGRIPFVAGAKPQHWMESLEQLDTHDLKVIVPGHGSASPHPTEAVKFTLGYLHFLHDNLSEAVENLMTFDEAYAAMDWSRYEKMPAAKVNRMNAYYVFLGLEAESVGK
jgi:glyoxylase-like metal-dependent hydrolase (beta-lactamase superfamily II)